MLLEKERQETKIIPTSPEKKEINLQVSHSHDKRREAPSVKKFFFESRRSASKPVMRTWLKPDKTTYTLRPDTRQSFSRAKVKRKESFDTYEDKIYNEAVSQSSRLMGL